MRLKDTILEIVNQLKSVTGIQWVAIWNNQFDLTEQKDMYSFQTPAAFIEVQFGETQNLGLTMTAQDVIIKVHLFEVQLDMADGTVEQNLDVFLRRNAIKKKLNNWKPLYCSALAFQEEEQDYNHNQVYHYTVSFAATFIDDLTETGDFIYKIPPTDIEFNSIPLNRRVFSKTFSKTFA